MDQREVFSSKERILVAMAAAMGAGCRICARGLYGMADLEGASPEEIEAAFREGLLQRERATELMRREADALLGRELPPPGVHAEPATRLAELARLAASVAANAAPDALECRGGALSSGATEVDVRVAIGIGRTVRGKAQGFSDAELGETGAEEAPDPAGAGCAPGESPCSC
jgi:alkylhydroperoxidase/carboxymuconolactone decarboxylase family protein YurZ